MIGLLTKFIPGGWILYAIIGVAVFGAGSVAGYKARGYADAPVIARAQTAQARAEADTARTRTALANQRAQTALDAQAASESALASQKALQAQVADLTSKLGTAERARQAASTKLLDTLKAIPHEQQSPLPASSRQYLRGVLDAQRAAANPAPANNPDQNRLPLPGSAGGTSGAVSP